MDDEILEVYRAAFPDFIPSCFQQDVMLTTITDIEAWKETVMYWALNSYRPQSIGRMLECYSEKVAGRRKLPTVTDRLTEDRGHIIAPPGVM